MKYIREVTDEEKKKLGELLLLATTDKNELKKILLKLQTVQYIREHFNEIVQNAEKYKLDDIIDLLRDITAGQVLLYEVYRGDDETSGFYDIDVADILKVRPAFEHAGRYSVEEFCRAVTEDPETEGECADSLEHVKVILWVPLKCRLIGDEFIVASMLLHLY